MDLQLETLQDEYAELLELHDELEEGLDDDDPEVRAVWMDIQTSMRKLRRRLQRIQSAHRPDPDEIEELESMLEEVNDAFGELALLR